MTVAQLRGDEWTNTCVSLIGTALQGKVNSLQMITTRGTLLVAICFLGPSIACQQPPSDDYVLGADSKPRAGIPAGKTLYFDITDSKVFPNSRHTITVYVPAAYRGDKPACVYVGLDGLGFGASQVFDNLIAQKAMPVTIGIGVSSGSVDSAQPPENPRFDRSFEFDNLNDRLARFLLDEVLPAVEEQKTTDSRPILLSKNPNDRSIGGGSTGGIAAFNVAWQRPEEFRRVFTAIGTFVGMRGGEQFYVLVRKTEPKPLRIFMQDGVNDEWGGGPEIGDWWMSNQTMERALSFAGYDVRHVWGTGAHSDRHAASLFPDAMRWLWRDWPEPVVAHPPGNPVLQSILDESSKWEVVAKQCGDKAFLAAGPNGQIYVSRAGASQADAAFPIAEQPETQSCAHSGIEDPVAFTADGQPVLAAKEARALGKGFHVDGLTVCSNKDVYLTAQAPDGAGQIWRISADGKKTQLDRGLEKLSGIALSPDGLWLMAARAGCEPVAELEADHAPYLSCREELVSTLDRFASLAPA